MRNLYLKKGASQRAARFIFRYLFALTVSLVAWSCEICMNGYFPVHTTPFLPGFAAIIASAAWAGFGPGVFSTAIVTAWCAFYLRSENLHTVFGDAVRLAMFAAEGLLLSVGSGRMRLAGRRAARSEDWHRKLLETASEGIWVVNEDGVVGYANARIAEIVGTPGADLKGRAIEEYFFPEDRSIEKIRFERRRAGMKDQFDRRLRTASGAEAWVLTCCNTFQDPATGALGVLSMMTDITERKTAEYALRRSEQRFRGLFENVLEGVYQSTPEGRILAANPMLLRMLGLSSEAELNDVNIARDLYVDLAVRSGLLEKLERDGSFQNVEYELRRRDGRVITVQENARVVRDEEGRVLYYEGTLTDISERTRIEAQLRQAQKVEALGRLAGGIAHDFSNVLTVVSGYSHLVLGELAPSHPARPHAQHLLGATESASGLTAQLLSFSRWESEPASLKDLNWIVRDSQECIRAFLSGQDERPAPELILSLCPRALPVRADSGHIRQILLSLAGFVRDSARGGAAIHIETAQVTLEPSADPERPVARTAEYALLSVMDGGNGSPEPRENAGGPAGGFGLSTTQAILSQYEGFLAPQRTAGGSICFSVYLPLGDDLLPAHNPGTARKTILLVEDEPLMRELSREMLERNGYRVLVAPGPREAERMGRQDSPLDLLITDVEMPELSGPELARRLRADNSALKVIFISGYADTRPEDSGITASDVLLQKPFSADSLGRKIRQVLDLG